MTPDERNVRYQVGLAWSDAAVALTHALSGERLDREACRRAQEACDRLGAWGFDLGPLATWSRPLGQLCHESGAVAPGQLSELAEQLFDASHGLLRSVVLARFPQGVSQGA